MRRAARPSLFLRRLIQFLREHSEIICYENGHITIRDVAKLVHFLPDYFLLTKYDSFRRRLNMHGFQRDRGIRTQRKYQPFRKADREGTSMAYKYVGPPGSKALLALEAMETLRSSQDADLGLERDRMLTSPHQVIERGEDEPNTNFDVMTVHNLEADALSYLASSLLRQTDFTEWLEHL